MTMVLLFCVAYFAVDIDTLNAVLADRYLLDFAGDLEELARAIISLVEACVLPLRHRSPDEVHGMLSVMARTLFRAYARSEDALRLAAP